MCCTANGMQGSGAGAGAAHMRDHPDSKLGSWRVAELQIPPSCSRSYSMRRGGGAQVTCRCRCVVVIVVVVVVVARLVKRVSGLVMVDSAALYSVGPGLSSGSGGRGCCCRHRGRASSISCPTCTHRRIDLSAQVGQHITGAYSQHLDTRHMHEVLEALLHCRQRLCL